MIRTKKAWTTSALVASALMTGALGLTGAAQAETTDPGAAPRNAALKDTTNWGKIQRPILTGSTKSFTFATSKAVTARFVIGDLVNNYDLKLTTSSGKVLERSARSGVKFEEIVRKLPAGTYKLVVTASGSASSSSFYLRGVKYTKPAIVSSKLEGLGTESDMMFSVHYINPTTTSRVMRATVKLYDKMGGYLRSERLEYYAPALSGRTGVAGWSYMRNTDAYSYKLVDVAYETDNRCKPTTFGTLSNVKITRDESSARLAKYTVTALARAKVDTSYSVIATMFDKQGNIIETSDYGVGTVPPGEPKSIEPYGFFVHTGAVPFWDLRLTANVTC
ncbi:MAG: hypothetical protein JWQ74_1011 [Marmoricola sp.]|nr:hypothetical protein [Marmoricola sp.]